MKMAKQTLNRPEWVGYWLVVTEVGISCHPAVTTQQVLQIEMPILCQTFPKVDYSFWTEMNKELQPSTCDGRVLPHW